VEEQSKYSILDDIEPPPALADSWQRSINVLAEAANVPAALIMRVHSREIEVFLKSQNPENVYEKGEMARLDTGLYCETVMTTGSELVVPNALADPEWDHNPDIELDMISYCGLPLFWPTGDIFGTICILDNKENPFSNLSRDLLDQFRGIVQAGLETVYENHLLDKARQERNETSRDLEQQVLARTRELQQAKTAADQSERTLHAVIDAIPAMISAKDRESRYILMNRYQADLYGTTPAEAIGKTASEVLGEAYGTYTEAIDAEIFKTNTARLNYEENWRDPSGRQHFLLTTKVPLRDRSGTPTNVVTVALDISARKHAEAEVMASKEEAESANRAKSEFLATMSHEFRTPLNVIIGFSELLRAEAFGPLGSENYGQYADDIRNSGEHMLALVNDILDIAAIEAGKRTMTREPILIGELLADCLRHAEKAAADGEIELSLDVSDDLPELHADLKSVTQIVQNLLSNAIKFTQRQGRVEVSASAARRGMTIQVKDTGIGIAADRLPDITEPFSQSHSNPLTSQDGTGLGLSIVKSLVAAHDGELDIESEIGTGTAVKVTFPTLAAGC